MTAQRALDLARLRPNSMREVEIAGRRVLVCRTDDDTVFACDAACTHENEPLVQGRLKGTLLTCIFHDAQFDVRSGAVVRGPAARPLRTYRATIRDGTVYVDIG